MSSVMGMVNEKQPLIRKKPFRNVHHTATRAALIGGGMNFQDPGR